MNSQNKLTFLLNWYANPYHTPIFIAKVKGFYQEEDLNIAILEPTDPSDVTEMIGSGGIDLGLKAMIHTIAGRAKGFPITSIGTLLDEPPTGLIALKSSGIEKFHDIIGKRVGYIGEFGKKIIDDLAKLAGIDPQSYQTVRVGMNVSDAILRNVIDTGIGFINFQKVELEYSHGEVNLIRIDQLAGLGCCCFCSIQMIGHSDVLQKKPDLVAKFMHATQRGAAFTTESPEEAYELLCQYKPQLRSEMYLKIFLRTLPFFSRNLLNVERDWNKVARYTKHLGIIAQDFDIQQCYTNQFIPEAPYSELKPIACCL